MRAKYKTNLALFLFALCAATAILLICLYSGKRNLMYQGRPTDYWFTKLPITMFSSGGGVCTLGSATLSGQEYGDMQEASLSYAAFDSFGIDAVPYLMSKLAGQDSSVERTARKLALRAKIKEFPARFAALERGQAVTGLIHLRNLPDQTIQMLRSLSQNPNTQIAAAAMCILKEISEEPGLAPETSDSLPVDAND